MEEKRSRNSRFASLPGLCCLLFFAVTAVYFRAGLIAAFLLLFFLLCLSSYVWSRGICRHVDLSLDPGRAACHAGETLILTMKVRNKSLLPLVWLDVLLPAGPRPQARPLLRAAGSGELLLHRFKGEAEARPAVRERFVWLLWRQEAVWQEELTTARRGAVEIGGAGLKAGDGFGLSARSDWYPLAAPLRLLIYPPRTEVRIDPFLRITLEAAARNRGLTEDASILKSSRAYRPGDPMKRINWRLLAGSGKMSVNVYETVMPGCAAFLVDLKSYRKIVEKEDSQGQLVEEVVLQETELERMLSLVGSCMEELDKRGVQSALFLPAYGRREAAFSVPREGESALKTCLEELALADYQGEETFFPYEEFWQISPMLGQLYICARTDAPGELEELARQLGRGRAAYLAQEKAAGSAGEFVCLYEEDILCR